MNTKMLILIPFALMFFASNIYSQQQIVGKWKTIDDDTGEAKSIVEIYEKGGKYYGKIDEILVKEDGAENCSKCEGKFKNTPMKGVVIMNDLQKDGNEYEDGTITDPENGKTYRCKIWIDEDDPNVLNVRGYIAFLYRTQQWVKK